MNDNLYNLSIPCYLIEERLYNYLNQECVRDIILEEYLLRCFSASRSSTDIILSTYLKELRDTFDKQSHLYDLYLKNMKDVFEKYNKQYKEIVYNETISQLEDEDVQTAILDLLLLYKSLKLLNMKGIIEDKVIDKTELLNLKILSSDIIYNWLKRLDDSDLTNKTSEIFNEYEKNVNIFLSSIFF